MATVLTHAHSDWSHDGTLTLKAWIPIAREIGCDAVLLTEHEETGWTPARYAEYASACRNASTRDVTLVPGLEFEQNGVHVLCYGLQHLPTRPSTAAALAAAVHEQGCFLCLAHPGKYRWSFPVELIAAIDAIEVWNSKWIYDGLFGPHPSSLALAIGKRIMVGQDVHKRKHLSTLFVQTATAQVVEDLSSGRYTFVLGGRQWTEERLRARRVAGAVQRMRTAAMRMALQSRRVLKKIARARPHESANASVVRER